MPEIEIAPGIERQAPERTEHPLEIDYQEVAEYAHNPRCYYWTNWLGLRVPEREKDIGEAQFRHLLKSHHDHTPAELPAEAGTDGFSRVVKTYTAYTRPSSHWNALRGPKYFSRPIGSTLSYGGLLDASVLVNGVLWFVIHKFSEHRTDSDSFINRHKGSPEFLGYHWLGHYAWRLMKETIPEDTKYGGIILDGIQMTKTIDRRITTYLTPTAYQIEQFVRNAYVMGEEIIRRRELTRKHLEMNEPARNAWPNWPTHGEHFCPWKALNLADSIKTEEDFLETCTNDPWWIRRES